MMGKLLCTVALLWSATALRADVFSFSFSGTGMLGGTVTASGTITATQVVPGIYTIVSISGTESISGVVSGATLSMADSTLIYSGGNGNFDFLVHGLGTDTVLFTGSSVTESGAGLTLDSGTNFKIGAVPETSTLSLLFAMGLGVWLLARKLLPRKHGGA